MAKGGNYMNLALFLVVGYIAWKLFLGDLVDEGISKVKSAMYVSRVPEFRANPWAVRDY